MRSFKQTIKESDESKKDFLKYVDNYKNVVSKAFDFDKKAVQAGNPIDIKGMQSWITAYHSSMERYNNAVKNKTLTESKKHNWNSIDFENVPGGVEVFDVRDGIKISMFSGGSGYGNNYGDKWSNGDDSYEIDRRPIIDKIIRDLLPVCDRFDKEVEAVMKKHGFKK